jgi:DNA-binding beta-propeller fold protein YncE
MDPVGICSDGTSVWVANKGRCDVTRLRCSDGANLGTFPLPATPNNIRSDGVHIWVISYEDIIKINPSNGAVLAEFKGFSSNSCICSDSQSIWVADGWGTIIKASVNDGAKLITYETGTENLINNISDICLDKDRTNIWVANFAANNVIKLQTSDGSVVVKHSAIWPTCLCFDGQNIWVSNMGSASVTKIRASDGIILGSYVVGDNPRYICSDGECIWVSNFNSGWLTKLNISDGTKLGMFKVGDSLSYICFDGSNIWVIDKQDTQ